tara:strand:- start:1744 stop:2520 length:777 start_codon:yes stop_codon:yes gene_type:complete
MSEAFDSSSLDPIRGRLLQHPVFQSVTNLSRLGVFMQHHVFAVWDFMSLLKALQKLFAPHGSPWLPDGDGELRRFLNEIVTEEESDQGPPGTQPKFMSHFELYRHSMRDIGIETSAMDGFIGTLITAGLQDALAKRDIPEPARVFMKSTFAVIETGQPHRIAAAFALGRETIIPGMFQSLLAKMKIEEPDAPAFYYYLTRHTELDGESHGPMALRMLLRLCNGDRIREQEMLETAQCSLESRIHFWDGVNKAVLKLPA